VRELLLKYDTDGIHLDFARWGNRQAYDVPSLVLVLEQIARIRTEASEKWDHPVTLSARIPFEELAATEAGEPVFIEALSQWAAAGLLDRFMVCLHEPGRSRLAEEPSLRHYADAVQGTDVEFWLDMYQGTWHTGGGRCGTWRSPGVWWHRAWTAASSTTWGIGLSSGRASTGR
jgi:hypothetical protein